MTRRKFAVMFWIGLAMVAWDMLGHAALVLTNGVVKRGTPWPFATMDWFANDKGVYNAFWAVWFAVALMLILLGGRDLRSTSDIRGAALTAVTILVLAGVSAGVNATRIFSTPKGPSLAEWVNPGSYQFTIPSNVREIQIEKLSDGVITHSTLEVVPGGTLKIEVDQGGYTAVSHP